MPSKYQRILILGSAGSGKTTLGLKLQETLDMPIIHLDKIYWLPNWQIPTPTDWEKTVQQSVQQEQWIIDGNYASTLQICLNRAQIVIFLDIPKLKCVWSVIKRSFRYMGRTRPDMGSGCPEKLDFRFIKWVWNFKKEYYPQLKRIIDNNPQVEVVYFRSRKKAREFINNLR